MKSRVIAGVVGASLGSFSFISAAITVLGGWTPYAVFFLGLAIVLGAVAGGFASLPFVLGRLSASYALAWGAAVAWIVGSLASTLAGTISPLWHGVAIAAGWLIGLAMLLWSRKRDRPHYTPLPAASD